MADHRTPAQRRPLITGVVAAAALCGVWMLPSAHAGDEASADDAEVTQNDGSTDAHGSGSAGDS